MFVDVDVAVRVANVLLAVAYIPLLLLRVRSTPRDYVWQTVGLTLLCLGIITGSTRALHARTPVHWPAYLIMLGLVLAIMGSARASWRRRRRLGRRHAP